MRGISRVTESNWIWPWAYRLHFSGSGSRTARLRPLLHRCAAGESKFDTPVEPRARWHARLGSDYQGCNAACDHPTAFFYRELTSQYSQAKFILTTRDPERWYVSASATILSEKVQQDLERSPIAPMVRKMHARLPGLYSRDKDQVLDAFRTHYADVRRYLSADRLLIFQAGDGWQPLCNFLGVACPTTEYPHANEGKDFQDEWKSRFKG